MHTVTELGASVPAFLGKLWKLVEDPDTDDLICWSPNGRSFFIRNQAQFARELLPHYYKHNNMASFVRQLNMYGFHKKVSVDLGGLKCDKDEMEFAHQYFCKGHPYLLEHIKRKIANTKGQDTAQAPIKSELMNKMLTEVRSMRGRQENLDSRLGVMKRENEALWRELAILRQKHHKQQQIVNKLIHFLVTLVQPQRGGGLPVKRRYPLMIDDTQLKKYSKIAKPQPSPTGPVIHELDSSDHDLDSEYIVDEILDSRDSPEIQSPSYPDLEPELEDSEDMETINLVADAVRNNVPMEIPQVHLQTENEPKRQRKGKRKRKIQVPVKIVIPPMENGEEPREETIVFNVPQYNANEESPVAVAILKNNSQGGQSPASQSPRPGARSQPGATLKPIPLATKRSSKLAAMAANMSKQPEVEEELLGIDLDSSIEEDGTRTKDKESENDELAGLEDILLGSGQYSAAATSNDKEQQQAAALQCGDFEDTEEVERSGNDVSYAIDNGAFGVAGSSSENSKKSLDKFRNNGTGASSSKDLSLSCIGSVELADAVNRLGQKEHMDCHLDNVQSELDNIRDLLLRGDGYSIDANTLLGLFGTADDPMSFGIPVNPELNPQRELDANETNSSGELITYNPNTQTNLLDFDEDIFLGEGSSFPEEEINAAVADPLNLIDRKTSFNDNLSSGRNTMT